MNESNLKWRRVLDSDEELEESLKDAKVRRPKRVDPLGIWSDDDEDGGKSVATSNGDEKEEGSEEESEEGEEKGNDSDGSSKLASFPLPMNRRFDRSPSIPGPSSLEKNTSRRPTDITAARERSVIEVSDSDDGIQFPVLRTSEPVPPVPSAQPNNLAPRPHPLFDKDYNTSYNNEQFKPPSRLIPAPKVHMLSYDDPILQKQQQPAYFRAEVNSSSSRPVAATPIAIPTNPIPTVPLVEDFGQLHFVDDPLEPRLTQAQVDEQLKELVGQALEEVNGDFKEEEKIVESFEEGFELLDHQVLARRWMSDRETGVKMGGILADDMGLGKTIQMLVRISDGLPTKEDRKAGWAKSTLVVCPVGLMDQWVREIAKFAPWMKVEQHHGAARASNPAVLERNHVVITSYNIVSNEYAVFEPDSSKSGSKKAAAPKKKAKNSDDDFIDDEDDEIANFLAKRKPTAAKKAKKLCALFEVQWWRIVLDEAHNIKNRSTKMSIAACQLPGKFRWALTGTPIQNNVEELYPLMKFLRIRPLNDWQEFKVRIADPVKKGRTKSAMKRLHFILKAVMLRRTKTSIVNGKPILHLPARNVQVVECEFDEDEKAFYEALASKVALTFNKYLRAGEVMKNYTSVLTLLLRLRQACNHPSLVSKDFALDADALESTPANDDDSGLAAALEGLTVDSRGSCQMCMVELTESNHNKNSKRCTSCDVAVAVESRRKSVGRGGSGLPPSSAKIRKVIDLLIDILEKEPPEGETPEKVIIFSQFTSFLDLLEPFVVDEQIKFVRVDGSMLPQDRAAAVEKIKRSRSTRVILISFKAGSTGLNLTCCNHVILTDLWWNPALEDQAFDRAHRMGQKRDVEIYKLTIPQTVEERILKLQDDKRVLAAAALSGDKFKSGNKLRLEDLVRLFKGDGHGDSDDE